MGASPETFLKYDRNGFFTMARFEEHRREIHERIMKEHPELAQRFKERRHRLDKHLKERRPEVYDLVVSLRELEKRKDME